MKKLTLLILLALGLECIGQEQPVLTTGQLNQDFEIFKASIKQIHGGLYWYNDSSQIDSKFDYIESKLNQPLELSKFYSLLQEFYASLGCGHSWMSMPKAWRDELDQQYRFPFYMFFESDRVFLTNDMTPSNSLNIGWELDSINGEAAIDVFRSLWAFAPSDGYNQTKRAKTIIWDFDRYYQTFNQLTKELKIVLKNPDNQERLSYAVNTISKNQRDSIHSVRKTSMSIKKEPLLMEITEDYAYLKIKGFTPWHIKVKSRGYKKFLKKNFKTLRESNTEKLILDLRGNGGGKDRWGAWLCRYLINEDFKYFEKMEARTRTFDFKENSSNKGLNLVGKLFKKDKKQEGLYQWTHHNPLKTQKSSKYAFQGKLVVLIDGGTFSTAADVASVVSSNTDAIFIGQEVGGGYYGNTSAISYSMHLENSNIWYQIPVVRYTTATLEDRAIGHGVTPDLVMENTYEDWKNGQDAILEKAKSEIK